MTQPFREEFLRVPRTARYVVLGDPSSCDEPWFVLHGYRQLAGRFIRRFDALPGVVEGRRAVVAPEALSRFYVDEDAGHPAPHGPGSRVGATWMTREAREHEIRDYVEYLDRLWEHVRGRPARTVVLGFSQGAETASRWCVLGRIRPAELILWGGGLAAGLDAAGAAAALADVRVTFVVGDEDAWARRRSAEGMDVLGPAGVECRVLRYTGGHRVEPAVLREAWPAAR